MSILNNVSFATNGDNILTFNQYIDRDIFAGSLNNDNVYIKLTKNKDLGNHEYKESEIIDSGIIIANPKEYKDYQYIVLPTDRLDIFLDLYHTSLSEKDWISIWEKITFILNDLHKQGYIYKNIQLSDIYFDSTNTNFISNFDSLYIKGVQFLTDKSSISDSSNIIENKNLSDHIKEQIQFIDILLNYKYIDSLNKIKNKFIQMNNQEA